MIDKRAGGPYRRQFFLKQEEALCKTDKESGRGIRKTKRNENRHRKGAKGTAGKEKKRMENKQKEQEIQKYRI